MYLEHFRLKEMPFKITPDPRFLYMTPQHQEALGKCQYVIKEHSGLAVVYGDVGMGKTTIARRLFDIVRDDEKCKIAMLPTPSLKTQTAFLTAIMDELEVPTKRSYRASLNELCGSLMESYQSGVNTVIIIDEAQKLTAPMFDVVHTLLNVETNTDKLLQMILVGQNELAATIDRIRPIKSRVATFGSLPNLTPDDTRDMIAFRWQVASGGKSSDPFTEDALVAVYRTTRGLPREINKVCHEALLRAFVEESKDVKPEHVYDAASELRLEQAQEDTNG